MLSYAVHGTMKPPLGAVVNTVHPLGQKLLCALLFNDLTPSGSPVVTPGSWTDTGANVAPPPTSCYAVTGSPTWRSNAAGACLHCTTSQYVTLAHSDYFVPTTAVTICVVMRKTDTTARTSSLFGLATASATFQCNASAPYSDGITYWNFGGSGWTTASGLTYSTSVPDRLVFTGGPAGTFIWQNGVKVASSATAVTRQVLNQDFFLNSGSSNAQDDVEWNYFGIYETQWSDHLCQWWSAEPYAHLYAPRVRTSAFMATPSVTAVTGALSSAGVGAFAAAGGVRPAHPLHSGAGAKKHRPGKTRR